MLASLLLALVCAFALPLMLTAAMGALRRGIYSATPVPLPSTILPVVGATARGLGLRGRPCPDKSGRTTRLASGNVELVAREDTWDDDDGHTMALRLRLSVSYAGGGKPVSLSTDRLGRPLLRCPAWAVRCETGDPGFDAAFSVYGARTLCAAALDSATRAKAMGLLARGMKCESWGTLELELDLRIPCSEAVASAIKDLVALAERLQLQGPTVAAELVRVAREDPVAPVRARALDLLNRNFGRRPTTMATLTDALGDSSDEVKFAAARAIGGESGRAVMQVLAASPTPVDVRLQALNWLFPDGSTSGPSELLAAALADSDESVRSTAAHLIATLREPAHLARLLRASHCAGEVSAASIARALGRFHDARAEAALVRTLALHASLEVRTAAVQSLARAGTVAAVAPLRRLGSSVYLFGTLAAEIREAITVIQARAGNVEVGAVTIAGGDALEGSLTPQQVEGELAVALESGSTGKA